MHILLNFTNSTNTINLNIVQNVREFKKLKIKKCYLTTNSADNKCYILQCSLLFPTISYSDNTTEGLLVYAGENQSIEINYNSNLLNTYDYKIFDCFTKNETSDTVNISMLIEID